MPLEPKDVTASGLVQFPTVVGGDVPVVNLDGIGPGGLVLDGPTLADIFLGKITKWDDPAIKKLNPNVKLPSNAIVVVHRSDGSGTTFIFTNYLSKMSPDWKSNVGASTSVEWPVGLGAKGNEGVSNNVAQTKGAIGYVEYAYALQNKMTTVKMINKDGKAVEAELRLVPGRRGKRRLGELGPLLRHFDKPARGGYLADRRRDLHPDVSAAAGSRQLRPQRSSSSTGLTLRAAKPPKNSTMCRCRPRSLRKSKRLGRKSRGPTASRCSPNNLQRERIVGRVLGSSRVHHEAEFRPFGRDFRRSRE